MSDESAINGPSCVGPECDDTGRPAYTSAPRPYYQPKELLEVMLVRQVLLAAEARDWFVHTLGMFRLNLADNLRLNVWDDRVRDPRAVAVHTHPYEKFESRVLCGEIESEVFDVRMPSVGDIATHVEHRVGADGSVARRSVVLSRLMTIVRYSGETYSLAGYPHRTRAKNGTVTSMMIFDKIGTSSAYVPIGADAIGAIVRPAQSHEIAGMSRRALEVVENRARELGADL